MPDIPSAPARSLTDTTAGSVCWIMRGSVLAPPRSVPHWLVQHGDVFPSFVFVTWPSFFVVCLVFDIGRRYFLLFFFYLILDNREVNQKESCNCFSQIVSFIL